MTISAMNLKNKHWKKIILISLGVILGGLLLAFFIRVAVWEAGYYAEKEGSERVKPVIIESDAVDETPVTEEQIESHQRTCRQESPCYLTVSRLNVARARVIEVGTTKNGEVGTPTNIFDVGWYNKSSRPGYGGKILIDGHNGGPRVNGVFKQLPSLQIGDIITIERGDGLTFDYRVVENHDVLLVNSSSEMRRVFEASDVETLVLISCTGEWDDVAGTYKSRQFVYAELIRE